MIMDTNYDGDGNCNKLVNYLQKEQAEMYDHTGRELDDDELNEFVRKSKNSEMERMITLSPVKEAGDAMSDDEMSLHARKTMNEYFQDRPEASYCYSIHRDTDVPHVQVAVHGNYDSLKMYEDEIEEMNEMAQAQWQDEELAEDLAQQEAEQQRASASESESDGLSQSISRSAD